MPSDANGVYSLPDGYEAVTGETIQASQHNPPLEDLASAMSARLMRTGAAPMTGPLKLVDGSVGSPALQFNSDSSSGIYKTSGGLGVAVGGVKVAEFTSSGVSRMIGELIPWTLLQVTPSGWVLPYGQTLSRTTYAALWELAQTEIAAGSLFYNNGDGSTTFGIGDLRGRVVAGRDGMGGTLANRLSGGAPGVDGSTIGATGGGQTVTLTTTQIPSHSHANTLNDPGHKHQYTAPLSPGLVRGSGNDQAVVSIDSGTLTSTATTGITITNASAGGGGSHNNVQPTMICNYLLYVGA
jgi:microcystin-dependent protein